MTRMLAPAFREHTPHRTSLLVPDDLRCPSYGWDSNSSKKLPGWAVYKDILGVHPVAALVNFKVGTDYTCQTADYDEAAGIGSRRTLAHIAVEVLPPPLVPNSIYRYWQMAADKQMKSLSWWNSHA